MYLKKIVLQVKAAMMYDATIFALDALVRLVRKKPEIVKNFPTRNLSTNNSVDCYANDPVALLDYREEILKIIKQVSIIFFYRLYFNRCCLIFICL